VIFNKVPIISTTKNQSPQIIEHTKGPTTYKVGNPGPDFGHAQI
jgi:hypothetical protein